MVTPRGHFMWLNYNYVTDPMSHDVHDVAFLHMAFLHVAFLVVALLSDPSTEPQSNVTYFRHQGPK